MMITVAMAMIMRITKITVMLRLSCTVEGVVLPPPVYGSHGPCSVTGTEQFGPEIK